MELSKRVSKTEYKIIGQLACGLSEKEIAAANFTSHKTVRAQTYSARKKLKARCAADLVRMFILDLENPKKYFAAIGLLSLQLFIITTGVDVDMRRTNNSVRVVRTARKKIS